MQLIQERIMRRGTYQTSKGLHATNVSSREKKINIKIIKILIKKPIVSV